MNDIVDISALPGVVGRELGVSEWITVDQSMIDLFADATGDRQWIHTDVKRAASGPFGGTVAHGLLTLSLLPSLAAHAFEISGVSRRINYGYDRVRFPRAVRPGSQIRDRIRVTEVEMVPGGAQVHFAHTVEIAGEDRPACVADAIVRLFEENQG